MKLAAPLKLTNLWRVIREVDLHAIRAAAHAPFELWLIDQGDGSAERLRQLVVGDTRVPHPSVRVLSAADFAAAGSRPEDQRALPAAAIAIAGPSADTSAGSLSASIDPGLQPGLGPALAALRKARVPTVVVIVDDRHPDGRAEDRLTSLTERHLVIRTVDAEAVQALAMALLSIASADLRLAMARQFPVMRQAYFEVTIEETANANASYALTTGLAEVIPVLNAPLNLGDMIVLTKNQVLMSYRIVLAAGRDGEPRAIVAEILGVLGGGLLFRQLARQLVGLIPIAGLIPKVAIAYGGTWAIGRAIAMWVTDGREVTGDLVRTLSAEGLQRGRGVATRLVDQARVTRGRAVRRWERLKEQLPLVGRRGGGGGPS